MRNRRDGKRVTNISGMHSLLPHFKPSRADSDVYINHKLDVTELVKYYEKLKKNEETKHITYFHLFCAAMGMTVYNRPLLNRFVINKKYYDREEVSISFVAKKEFTDTSEENLSVIKINEEDDLNEIANKISSVVKEIRSKKNNLTDDFINNIGKLPKIIKALIVGLVKFGDNHDLLPKSLTANSIYHSTVLVSNLGSLGCGAIYHNLTDFGTNSILITIGEIKDEAVVINGKVEVRKVCELGANLDERIADGFYFIKSIQLLEHILNNPSLLEKKSNTKINLK